ncbi:MAG: phosphoribosylformylglycinamidine synthase subunit PurS [Alphaproteobacteria bacterium]|nr:phosphoribosylformylglycinamidine synthase subunit PurS [Alphaproteobacteria bacterium]
MKIQVFISLKKGVLDRESQEISATLKRLGFSCTLGVRQTRIIEIELDDMPLSEAETIVEQMCKKVLVNSVIEVYHLKTEVEKNSRMSSPNLPGRDFADHVSPPFSGILNKTGSL